MSRSMPDIDKRQVGQEMMKHMSCDPVTGGLDTLAQHGRKAEIADLTSRRLERRSSKEQICSDL